MGDVAKFISLPFSHINYVHPKWRQLKFLNILYAICKIIIKIITEWILKLELPYDLSNKPPLIMVIPIYVLIIFLIKSWNLFQRIYLKDLT